MIIVIDTETSGLPYESRASVLEVGAVCLDNKGAEVSMFSSLVRPTHQLDSWADKATKVHGISNRLAEEAPSCDAVWEALLSWMSLYKPVEAVLAFNVDFDREMMARSFPSSIHLPWGPCLMNAAAVAVRGSGTRISLVNACSALGVSIPGGKQDHRALFDARLAAALFVRMVACKKWPPR